MQTMNYQEAADYLKITTGTLRNWVSKGRIKPRRVGRRVLFFREELEKWITSPIPTVPAPDPVKQEKPAELTAWAPKFTVSFADQVKEPYARLLDLPGKNVKMTPDDMRELARYLVDTASICDQGKCRGLTNFPIFRENERFRSSVVLVPFDQMRDLQTLALAALTSGDVLAATKEKYVVQFIRDGLKHQLPLVNIQLKKKGMRAISFKSLKK